MEGKDKEREREKESPKWPKTSRVDQAVPRAQSSSHVFHLGYGNLSTWVLFCFLSRHINRELSGQQSCQDSSQALLNGVQYCIGNTYTVCKLGVLSSTLTRCVKTWALFFFIFHNLLVIMCWLSLCHCPESPLSVFSTMRRLSQKLKVRYRLDFFGKTF